jgi:Cu+-exporting ATPase
MYWFPQDVHRGIFAFTSILIIACPCALAITVPFTFGNIMRILGRNSFYLKNAAVVESISKTDTIVFDKTGTATTQNNDLVSFEGGTLTTQEKVLIKSIAAQSIHPLSKKISSGLSGIDVLPVEKFSEQAGAGIEGMVAGVALKMGAATYVTNAEIPLSTALLNSTRVYVSINEKLMGYFNISGTLREGFKRQIQLLQKEYTLFLLSGDQEGDREKMQRIFPDKGHLYFRQSPAKKLQFIQQLQQKHKQVMMIGDGLNDAGALQQSDIGIAVSDDLVQFSPACDAIIKGSEFDKINRFIAFCKSGIKIIWFTFVVSLLYNIVGIAFAVQGALSPMFAAILMPLSSISVIVITTVATKWKAKKLGL